MEGHLWNPSLQITTLSVASSTNGNACISYGCIQSVTLTHGHLTLNVDVNCIVDDTVNNSLGFRIVLLTAGRKTLIPVFRAILTAENSGQSCCTEFLTTVAPNFHEFQQIGCLFFGQFPNQKLIKNKEVQLFVGTYDFAVTSVQTTQREGFQQFLHAAFPRAQAI